MRVVIIEGESQAAEKIKRVTEQTFNNITFLGLAKTNQEAKVILSKATTDLILCNTNLDGKLIFELLEELELSCPIIFVTAHDQYALQAHDYNCAGYILKPINEEQLTKSLKRAGEQYSSNNQKTVSPQLLNKQQEKSYKKRFVCKIGNRIIFIKTDDITCFFVEDKITFIQEASSGKKYIIGLSLEELENRYLDPSKFYRINRSAILNLDYLLEMRSHKNGRLKLLTQHAEFIVARNRVGAFKDWVDQ